MTRTNFNNYAPESILQAYNFSFSLYLSIKLSITPQTQEVNSRSTVKMCKLLESAYERTGCSPNAIIDLEDKILDHLSKSHKINVNQLENIRNTLNTIGIPGTDVNYYVK